MGNNTSAPPSAERVHTGLSEVFECINNSSLWPSHSNVARDNVHDGASRILSATSQHTYTFYHDLAQVGIGIFAALLLLFCALLAGLTLAICGLDETLVQLRAATGTAKERKQAVTVTQLKRHSTWMLCSLIICSCAGGETFPFLIQSLYHGQQLWLSILTSTLCLAIISEILPQYIIPRNAIAWGYYCWPVVWGCMILTSPISWPIAWLLDALLGRVHQDRCGIFSNDQLEELIRHHDQSENKGGGLGQDAARVAIGALKLESRTIGAEMMRAVSPVPEMSDMDIEKAEIIVAHGLVVRWSAVKTVKIDDTVDEAFLKKVKNWSYSRIPVISKAEIGPWVDDEKNLQGGLEDWDGTRIYGFLHTRNLIGLEVKTGLRVTDLPLYPLPVVRESMSIYELLNMFQLGMSRIAIVVANPKCDTIHKADVTPSVFHDPAEFSTMRWTATKRTNDKIVSKMRGANRRLYQGNDFLSIARGNATGNSHQQNVYGIRAPKPVGIVTFEDIIDTILQKTSRDEKDFFSPDPPTPPIKAKQIGGYTPKIGTRDLSPLGALPPIRVPKARIIPKTSAKNGILRFRTNSKSHEAVSNLDGTTETKNEKHSIIVSAAERLNREIRSESSYTENSNGGFHGSNESSTGSFQNKGITSADILKFSNEFSYDSSNSRYSHFKSTSLPSRNKQLKEDAKNSRHLWRNISASPALPAVLESSNMAAEIREQIFTYDGANDMERETPKVCMSSLSTDVIAQDKTGLRTGHNISVTTHDCTEIEGQHVTDGSGETIMTLSSWCEGYYEREDCFGSESLYDALPASMPRMQERNLLEARECCYDLDTITEERSNRSCDLADENFREYKGFPAELLDRFDENRVPNYLSFTLPRLPDTHRDFTPVREKTFDDDRALLPSQSKALQASTRMDIVAARCSSLWF